MITSAKPNPVTAVLLSFTAAALLAASSPGGPVPLGMWVALVPLIVLVRAYGTGIAFLGVFFATSLWYGLAFRWVTAFHPSAFAILILLEAPLFTLVPLWIARRFGTPKTWIWLFPSLWTLGDWVNHTWLFRFPFASLAYTQYGFREAIQVTSLGGSYLLTWIIAFVNACVAEMLLFSIRRNPTSQRGTFGNVRFAFIAIATFAAMTAYGRFEINAIQFPAEPALKVGLAQTLFPPKADWSKHEKEYLSRLTAQEGVFRGQGIDLLLLPELAVDRPLSFVEDITLPGNADILNSQADAAASIGAPIIFGCLERKKECDEASLYNSLAMFGPDKTLRGVYRKRVLVPFGEFNPFGNLFPEFGAYLETTANAVALRPGPGNFLFTVPGANGETYQAAALICYESTSPELAREDARNGADFFIAATSDYWSASPIAALQHSVISIFRAVETGKPVLRIANGGYSGYIDERGAFAGSVPLFREGNMVCNLYVRPNVSETPYVRFGNWIVVLSLALVLLSFYAFMRFGSPESSREHTDQ